MRTSVDESLPNEHDLRRLRAEIESALRCGALLDRLGVQFRFWLAGGGNGVRIELCGRDGEVICSVSPQQLLRLVGGGPSEVENWVAMLHPVGPPAGADRR